MANNPIAVRGLRELSAAFAKADKEARTGFRQELREVAEPVRATAEQLAESRITRIGPRWGRMRVGVTRRLVYVAPRQRGVNSKRSIAVRRPNLADLLMDRAMQPALDQHAPQIEARVEQALDNLLDRWGRGG